jgi:hypothetical protein
MRRENTDWSVRTYHKASGKFAGYLKSGDRTSWSKRAAQRHMVEFVKNFPSAFTAELEDNRSTQPK